MYLCNIIDIRCDDCPFYHMESCLEYGNKQILIQDLEDLAIKARAALEVLKNMEKEG